MDSASYNFEHHIFGKALLDADAWYQSQVLHQASLQLEPQYIIRADEGTDHELDPVPVEPPMLESQTATAVLTEQILVNKDTTPIERTTDKDSLPSIVCKRWSLHGRLIDNLPHECSETPTRNADGKISYSNSIKCGIKDCSMVFKKSLAFNRHYKTVHIRMAGRSKLDCTIEGCRRVGEEGFSRKDNLIQHMRSVHGEEIPKNPVRLNGSTPYWRVRYREPRHLMKGAVEKEQMDVEG